MRRLTILLCAVLTICTGICVANQALINPVLDEAHRLATEARMAMERGDPDGARESVVALATVWKERGAIMEVFCDHEDLHSVKECIIQAGICLEADMEDFYAFISLAGEGIEHIREEEAVRGLNLL